MSRISGGVTLTGRRAERFAHLVEARRLDLGESPESDLLDLVSQLRTVPGAPTPRPEFSASLRERLMLEAETVLTPGEPRLVIPERGPTGRARRRVTVAVATAVIVGSTGGLAVAAQGTVQGDPLYSVKRGLEAVTASVSLSDASRGRDYLDQSRTRLSEVKTLLANDPDVSPATEQAVRATLERFAASADRGSALLFASYQRDASSDHVSAVRDFADAAMGTLDRESRSAPARLQDAFSQAAGDLTDLDQQARVVCAACGDREPLTVSPALEMASSKTALDELMDNDSVEPAVASSGDRPRRKARQGPAQPTPPPTQSAAAPSVGSAVQGTLEAVTGSSSAPGRRSTTAPRGTPQRLLKLPGSQSGAPSVIDLAAVTDGVAGATDKLLGGTLGQSGTLPKTPGASSTPQTP